MAIESWIDKLAAVWEITPHTGKGNVRSYRLFERDEFPEGIDPEEFPVAISYPTSVSFEYSLGGPCFEIWNGQTEFHLFPNTNKGNLPHMLRYFRRIEQAAAGAMTLSSAVAYFGLRNVGGAASIQGPLTLQYGEEAPHHGLVAFWVVKSHIESEITPSA